MFWDDAALVQPCSILAPIADHCPTCMKLSLHHSRAQRSRRPFLNFSRADIPALNDFLGKVDWSAVFSAQDVSTALDSWCAIAQLALSNFVPRDTLVFRSENKPWYSSYLRRIARQRDGLFRLSRHLSRDHRLSVAYRRVRN